jgi:hypothetical protein
MPRISRQRIHSFFRRVANDHATTAQGRALEDLVCYLFGLVPGIDVATRNRLNAFDAEEIDVAFWNQRSQRGLHFLPSILLVECKNWSNPVGSQEVSYFATRLRHRGCDHGVLVAANGITGAAEDLTRAHQQIAAALAEGQKILVLTRDEIERLSTTGGLVRLLKQKLCELAVCGTLFLDSPPHQANSRANRRNRPGRVTSRRPRSDQTKRAGRASRSLRCLQRTSPS